MSYAVHEIFLTVQGEGGNIGRVSVFCRFAGCNLWSGREVDRAKAVCQFCDTDFVGGAGYETADALATAIAALWPPGQGQRTCVLTGGEPLLQVDPALIGALHARNFYVAVETNGTQPLTCPVDWVCVSPKAGAPLALQQASELKLVYPQPALSPASLAGFVTPLRWLSPMDGPALAQNVQAAAAYCMAHPEWRLAIQAHKSWNIP
jgi:7-carboxy-7-deazaguanine synthase